MAERDSRYYLGQLTDLKEDIIVKIMKTMRSNGMETLQDPDGDSKLTYKITNEPKGGLTLYSYLGDGMMAPVRTFTADKLVGLLEMAENSTDNLC